ncbi:TetR/AcrR family transcriptional regulator [Secundilactobacillus silagei]|uniref:TetR/AcrR family transcriptional regulator n=1 Tax=Secundilactobacillus silagei TaxID=1293415 RepID=UPI0006D0CE6F|nr:TetR/AcrR family transcriptional regulator [Secundilactobacillus silagei]
MADNSLPRHHQSHRTTEQLIVQSFIDLLNETPNHPLKVIDICRKAYINRGTFYHYFESEEELVEACEDHLVNKLFFIRTKKFLNTKLWLPLQSSYQLLILIFSNNLLMNCR